MALVNVLNMTVLDNPTSFLSPFQFEITFECLQELDEDLEWKVLYVGSAHDADQDQVLDEILVGPVPVGLSKFVLTADAPNVDQLPATEVLGVTVVLVTCSYRSREFVRIGYYVNNEYIDPNAPPPPPQPVDDAAVEQSTNDGDDEKPMDDKDEKSTELPPPPPPAPPLSIRDLDINLVQRQVLAEKPRITKFPISWTAEQQSQPAAAAAAAAEVTTNTNDDVMAGEESARASSFAQTMSGDGVPHDKQHPVMSGDRMDGAVPSA